MVANLGPWQYVDRDRKLKVSANQGLTTVVGADGSRSLLFRGDSAIPDRLKNEGWDHIGDPDSSHGYIFDAYQGSATSKLFEVATPAGETFDYVHQLEGDEKFNNSYVAVSPDGQWMVSGEWDVMSRLLMFPTPILNPATVQTGGPLPIAAMITLDHPVRNVQGATFVHDTQLLCSTDDPDTDLWPTPHQLLQIDLPGPLAGAAVTAQVKSLGELPTESVCPGTFEVEGIDYDQASGDLRVDIVPPLPCGVFTTIYRFRAQQQ
jgi:hypothetical protein